jgi:hypothetical protein
MPESPLEGYRLVVQEMASTNPKTAAINARELVDARFGKKLEDSGFSPSLCKK